MNSWLSQAIVAGLEVIFLLYSQVDEDVRPDDLVYSVLTRRVPPASNLCVCVFSGHW